MKSEVNGNAGRNPITDTPSTILLTREQSTGSNTNLWGGYLITTQRMTEQAAKGYQTLAVTGDATISWTNYTVANTGSCAFLKLTGALSAAATLTFPTYQNDLVVWNNTGATVTIKCSGGTGVVIPNSRKTRIFCDAVDYYSSTPNWTTDSTTLTNSGDLPNYSQVQTLIANAALPATAGTVRVSASDTTANYLRSKLTAQYTGLTTTQLAGITSNTLSTVNAAGNEQVGIQIVTYIGAYINDGVKTSQYTPVVGHSAIIDTSSASFTINLTGMVTPQVEQSIKLTFIGGIDPFFLGTLNSTTNGTATVSGSTELVYVGGTVGWSCAVSATMGNNFTDANRFVQASSVSEPAGSAYGVYSPAGAQAFTTEATFWTAITAQGAIIQTTFTTNIPNTVLNLSATTRGEVAHIIGPKNKAAGAQTFVITRDGGTAQTIIISVAAGSRGLLTTGEFILSGTTVITQQSGPGTLDTTKRAFAQSSTKLLPGMEMAKSAGTSLFEFSRSLSVTITSTGNINSTNQFQNSAGVMYRTMGT